VPIATAVLVILAVFVPLLALGGGRGPALRAARGRGGGGDGALSSSRFTLVPALVDRLLPPDAKLDEPRVVGAIKRVYRPALDFALRRGVLVQVVAAGLSAAALWLGTRLGSDFLPALDEGALMVQTVLPSDSSLAAIDAANRQLEEALGGWRESRRSTGVPGGAR